MDAWLSSIQLPVDISQLLFIWVAILLSAILRSFTGFGFALAALPIFSIFLTPIQSVVLCTSLGLGIGITSFNNYWDKSGIKPLRILVIMSLMATPLGALLLRQMPLQYFKLGIGIAVIISCLFLSLYRPKNVCTKNPRPLLGCITGIVSGLLNGAFNIPGPPVIIYMMSTEPDPARSRSQMIMFFTISATVALSTYTLNGFVTLQSIYLFCFTFPIMLLGDKLGYILFKQFGSSLYRRISLVTLFSIGGFSVAQALHLF